VENASIALSNTLPLWQVLPYGNNIAEYEYTEKLEELIRCTYRKCNTRGVGTVLYDRARSAILFNMSATRIDDLASILPKSRSSWTNLQKEAFSAGRYILRAFHPKSVHVEVSSMGLVAVCQAEILRAKEVVKYWELFADDTKEGKMVKAGLEKMKEYMQEKLEDGVGLRDIWFAQYYFINHDQILRHGHFVGSGTDSVLPVGNDDIIFADEDNSAGFINWSVRMGGSRIESDPKYQLNPMLAGLYYSNVWETSNIIQSIVLSAPIAELERAKEIQYTQDGQRLPESDGVMIARPSDRVDRPPFPQIDPAVYSVLDRLEQSIVRTTGAAALGDVNAAKGTAFATLNAIIQVIMGRLDVQRRDIALACEDDARTMLKWVKYNKVPLLAYRQSNSRIAGKTIGEQLALTADEIDPYTLDIMCDIKPKTPTDFQQQVLTAIQLHDKTPLPWRELLQRLGFENTELLKQQRIREDFDDAEVRAAIENIMLQEQMKTQQAMQAQQPMTEMPNPGGGLSETAFGPLGPNGTQMNNPAVGGPSTANMQPGLTREAVSGVDQSGQSIGG